MAVCQVMWRVRACARDREPRMLDELPCVHHRNFASKLCPVLTGSQLSRGALGDNASPVVRLDTILDELLRVAAASRATIRLDWSPWGAHVDDVVAEARRPEVESLVGKTSIRQRDAETVKWLEQKRTILVQEDCAAGFPAPPQALLDVYGVRAQMLAPLVVDDALVGWISVHDIRSVRKWTQRDVAALESAAGAVLNVLGVGPLERDPRAVVVEET